MKKIDYKKGIVAVLSLSFIGLSGSAFGAGPEPYIGSIDYTAGMYPPRGYADCNGQEIAIGSNQALFAVIGTTYGGDGRTTFNLPEMRGRVPVHFGAGPGLNTSYILGQKGGTPTITQSVNQMPAHSHASTATSISVLKGVNAPGGEPRPGNNAIAKSNTGDSNFSSDAPSANMLTGSVTTTTTIVPKTAGGGQAFSIMQPFTALRCMIAVDGIYPPRS